MTGSTAYQSSMTSVPWRGPLLALTAGVSLAAPSLLQVVSEMSWSGLLRVLLLCSGIALGLSDAAGCLRQRWDAIHGKLDALVLDDVLRFVFDPEQGVLASCAGFFCGSLAMYGLPVDRAQRTRLLQSALWIDEPLARHALLRPGGWKILLPIWTKEQWHGGSNHNDVYTIGIDTPSQSVQYECYSSVASDDSSTSKEEEVSSEPKCASPSPRKRSSSPHSTTTTTSPSSSAPEMPLVAFANILQELVQQRLPTWCSSSTITAGGVTAATVLLLQLRYSPRARRVAGHAVHGATSLGLLAVISGACVTALRNSSVQQTPTVNVLLQTLQRLVGTVDRRWKGVAAVVVLWWMGRIRDARSTTRLPAGRY